jgi:bisphosphoglycerate-dependent phosphoglycerate mutase family 1
MAVLVLLRHGESEWNRKNLFAGWVDVDLTPAGEREARRAGDLLVEHGLFPDVLHTSLLRRAIRTAQITPRRRGSALDPGAPFVAAQRTALRRAAGQEQGAGA